MKLMEIYHDLIEGKQVGIIYHFTSERALKNIKSENVLRGFTTLHVNGKEIYGISTTRNKNLNYDSASGKNIRITLDGNKLSYNYKIVPYDYWQRQYNIPDNPQTIDEDEEIILTTKINNINRYIISIDKI